MLALDLKSRLVFLFSSIVYLLPSFSNAVSVSVPSFYRPMIFSLSVVPVLVWGANANKNDCIFPSRYQLAQRESSLLTVVVNSYFKTSLCLFLDLLVVKQVWANPVCFCCSRKLPSNKISLKYVLCHIHC